MNNETLTYLYGIVLSEAAEPPPEVRGLDGEPVRLVKLGDVAAVVSSVSADVYGDDSLNARLEDLAWVGARGLAHEAVLDWFAGNGPVIPLSLFSLHQDEGRVEQRVLAESESFERILARLRGKREWGVKLWRRESEARVGIDQLSASLQTLSREIDDAPPGRAFLLERKREALRTEELRAVSKRVAHEVFSSLRAAAVDGVAVPLPSGVAAADRVLLLHAAYLVADTEFPDFQVKVSQWAQRLTGSGFEIEFTGPWPPYHFSDPEDE